MARTGRKIGDFKRKKSEIIAALNDAHGIVIDAAKQLGLSQSGLFLRIQKDPDLLKARDEARSMEVDYLHSKMLDLVEKGDFRAIEFLMRKLGRNQGFGEEITIHSDNVNANFDASKLSEQEQENLYEAIRKGKTN